MGSFCNKKGLDSCRLCLSLIGHTIFVKKQVIGEGGLLGLVKKRLHSLLPSILGSGGKKDKRGGRGESENFSGFPGVTYDRE